MKTQERVVKVGVYDEPIVKKKIGNNTIPTKIFALGGLEEIGKNTYCVEFDDEILIIDAGVKFPDASQLGISAIVPDYTYLKENEEKIIGLFITHGHEDHIGGIPYLLDKVKIPGIYAPKLATALIKERIKEFKQADLTVVHEYVEDDVYQSKHFKIEFCAVNHSIPDSFGIHLETPNGSLFTTGDYKFDWTPLGHIANIQRLGQFGKKGIELLMADSTNAEVTGYTIPEINVIKNIDSLILKAPGRIIVAMFASNVHRLQEIIKIANKYSKKIAIIGWSLEKIIKVIRDIGHIEINEKLLIKQEEIANYPKNQILIICTGSQGEPMAALSKMARKKHPIISIVPGDTVIFSSSPIPGNRNDVEDVVNKLTKLGSIIIENNSNFKIHTSGHAAQEEQKVLFSLLKPKYFMPMHGEYRMLKIHGDTATKVNIKKENIFIITNGDQILLQNGIAKLGPRIPADPIFIDGKDTSGKASNIIKERSILSKDGLVVVIVSIDSKTNKISSTPKIVSRGCFYVKDSYDIINESTKIVTSAIETTLKKEKVTFALIKQSIKESIAPYIYYKKHKNPLIIPVVLNKKK